MNRRSGVMLKEKEVREECLYCHGHAKRGKPCLFCGDVRQADSLRRDPPLRPTSMFRHPEHIFEPWIAGV
jgi:methionyl-tRNA synthetase